MEVLVAVAVVVAVEAVVEVTDVGGMLHAVVVPVVDCDVVALELCVDEVAVDVGVDVAGVDVGVVDVGVVVGVRLPVVVAVEVCVAVGESVAVVDAVVVAVDSVQLSPHMTGQLDFANSPSSPPPVQSGGKIRSPHSADSLTP